MWAFGPVMHGDGHAHPITVLGSVANLGRWVLAMAKEVVRCRYRRGRRSGAQAPPRVSEGKARIRAVIAPRIRAWLVERAV